jgi:hypothetical protein
LELIRRGDPQVMNLDIRLKDSSGFDKATEFKRGDRGADRSGVCAAHFGFDKPAKPRVLINE